MVAVAGTVMRITRELQRLKEAKLDFFVDLTMKDDDLMRWEGLLLPAIEHFSRGAFRVAIAFTDQYPFRPPAVTFVTKIYHPSVDEKGHVCLAMLKEWKPSLSIEQVLRSLLELVEKPQADHVLRADLLEEFNKRPEDFKKMARRSTRENAEKRRKVYV